MRVLLAMLLGVGRRAGRGRAAPGRLTLPRGFHIGVFSNKVPQARELEGEHEKHPVTAR